jgi:hypothetical protein
MLSRIINKIGLLSPQKLAGKMRTGLNIRWKRILHGKPMSMAGYIYKTARLTETSEFEVFRKAAESWPVSARKIEQDFSAYLIDRRIPYYVTDFIRKNQKHLDELRMPLF